MNPGGRDLRRGAAALADHARRPGAAAPGSRSEYVVPGLGGRRRRTTRAKSSRRRWRTRSGTPSKRPYARSDPFERPRLMDDCAAYLGRTRRAADLSPRWHRTEVGDLDLVPGTIGTSSGGTPPDNARSAQSRVPRGTMLSGDVYHRGRLGEVLAAPAGRNARPCQEARRGDRVRR